MPPGLAPERRRCTSIPRPARCSSVCGHHPPLLRRSHPEQRMDPRRDPDNATSWDTFFANRRDMELARYKGDGPPPVDNNEAGRRLRWGSQTLEGVMNHILAGDYPRLRYPHFQVSKKGGNNGGDFITRTPYPPAAGGARGGTGVEGVAGVGHGRQRF
jgi:hypothetical protein